MYAQLNIPQLRRANTKPQPSIPSPSTLLVHGLEATGKSLLVRKVLAALELPHALVPSLECITTRHLLERALAACKDVLSQNGGDEANDLLNGSCETVSVLAVQLKYLLAGKEKFVLVFDGIDRQREAPPTLLPALARLGEIVRLPTPSVLLS